MIGRWIRNAAKGLLVGVCLLAIGCETGFIQDSAATSLASFLSDVFTTAVNDVLVNP